MQRREEERKLGECEESLTPIRLQQPMMQMQGNYQICQRKRYRRTFEEIERKFRCPVENCMKAYGCEGSLHPDLSGKHLKIAQDEFVSKEDEEYYSYHPD